MKLLKIVYLFIFIVINVSAGVEEDTIVFSDTSSHSEYCGRVSFHIAKSTAYEKPDDLTEDTFQEEQEKENRGRQAEVYFTLTDRKVIFINKPSPKKKKQKKHHVLKAQWSNTENTVILKHKHPFTIRDQVTFNLGVEYSTDNEVNLTERCDFLNPYTSQTTQPDEEGYCEDTILFQLPKALPQIAVQDAEEEEETENKKQWLKITFDNDCSLEIMDKGLKDDDCFSDFCSFQLQENGGDEASLLKVTLPPSNSYLACNQSNSYRTIPLHRSRVCASHPVWNNHFIRFRMNANQDQRFIEIEMFTSKSHENLRILYLYIEKDGFRKLPASENFSTSFSSSGDRKSIEGSKKTLHVQSNITDVDGSIVICLGETRRQEKVKRGSSTHGVVTTIDYPGKVAVPAFMARLILDPECRVPDGSNRNLPLIEAIFTCTSGQRGNPCYKLGFKKNQDINLNDYKLEEVQASVKVSATFPQGVEVVGSTGLVQKLKDRITSKETKQTERKELFKKDTSETEISIPTREFSMRPEKLEIVCNFYKVVASSIPKAPSNGSGKETEFLVYLKGGQRVETPAGCQCILQLGKSLKIKYPECSRPEQRSCTVFLPKQGEANTEKEHFSLTGKLQQKHKIPTNAKSVLMKFRHQEATESSQTPMLAISYTPEKDTRQVKIDRARKAQEQKQQAPLQQQMSFEQLSPSNTDDDGDKKTDALAKNSQAQNTKQERKQKAIDKSSSESSTDERSDSDSDSDSD
ncbi:hypothetical protein CI610_00106 [invertebrate metagenome]|uniref:Uncharacterized protein n=1 Tax=invertebrate metagenome TaxID=1711999 RepID=A0A2H9TCM3_9ZZZZ